MPRPCVLCKGGYEAADIVGLSCPTVCIALAVRIIRTLSIERTSNEDYVSGSGGVKSVTAGVRCTRPFGKLRAGSCTERKSGAPTLLLMPARPKGWATRRGSNEGHFGVTKLGPQVSRSLLCNPVTQSFKWGIIQPLWGSRKTCKRFF